MEKERMMVMSNYSNAYTEVYTILNCLDEEELSKIPEETLEAIEENRNNEYYYELDEELELREQPMLAETKAILFNLFRDYLSTPEQKEKIIKMQREERQRNEEKKKQEYQNTNMFERKDIEINSNEANTNNMQLVVKKEESIFKKIVNFIKNIFVGN